MYKQLYQLGIFTLTVILVAVMAIAGLKLTRAALPISPVVSQAEETVNENLHYIGEAEGAVNEHADSVEELTEQIDDSQNLVDYILNYEL